MFAERRGRIAEAPPLPGQRQLLSPLALNGLGSTLKYRRRRDVTDRAVQADMIVVMDELADHTLPILEGERCLWADAVLLECAVPPFNLTIALRVVRRRAHVCHAAQTDILLEVARDELRTVVGDHPRSSVRVALPGPLQDQFDLRFGYPLGDAVAKIPLHDTAAVPIEHATQVVERAADVDVADIDMPMLVRQQGLKEALAFARRLAAPAPQCTGLKEDTIDGAGADANLTDIKQ